MHVRDELPAPAFARLHIHARPRQLFALVRRDVSATRQQGEGSRQGCDEQMS